nr:MAG TPA: hypothetical protein [Caudoviricetes sp.]
MSGLVPQQTSEVISLFGYASLTTQLSGCLASSGKPD